MTAEYRVVEQTGDTITVVGDHTYDTFDDAVTAAVILNLNSDTSRELFVDGPNLPEPVPVDAGRTIPDRLFQHPAGRWTL